jgi:hypothetical protein
MGDAEEVPVNESRERVLAWTGAVLAALYFTFRGISLYRAAGRFEAMFEGLGAQLPAATQFAVEHRLALLVVLFGMPTVATVAKEWLIHDKRTSLMITMITVILVVFGADLLAVAYYLPLMDLFQKLS